MAEFKYIQWGKGVPVEYQRLNAMMNNDQYLKDIADPSPRGILAWKRQASFSVTGTGTFTGYSNVPFYVESNRLTSFTFYPGEIAIPLNSANAIMEIHFVISDGAGPLTLYGGSIATANSFGSSAPAFVIPNLALSVGAHTVTVNYAIVGGATWYMGYNGYTTLAIRDEGDFVASL